MEFAKVGSKIWKKNVKQVFFACCLALLLVATTLLSLKSDLERTESLHSIEAKDPTGRRVSLKSDLFLNVSLLSIEADEPTGPRVLLYITTHMSVQHEELLLGCWSYIIANSELVKTADVTVYVNGNETRREYNEALLRLVFYGKNITVHHSRNRGYQAGAISGMANGDKQGWFEGYDWVVRVNPDVVIRDDTYILSTIHGDAEVDGIFVDCRGKCKDATHCNDTFFNIHSDFTVFRPSAIPRDIFWNESGNAEKMNNVAFASVVRLGRDRWLPGASPQVLRTCRVTDAPHSPVAHYTPGEDGAHAQQCINWYKERNMTNV